MTAWKVIWAANAARKAWYRLPPEQRRKLLEQAGQQAKTHGPTLARAAKDQAQRHGPTVARAAKEQVPEMAQRLALVLKNGRRPPGPPPK